MGRHLVLVGGGHAHIPVLLHLDGYVRRGHRVTLISPAERHFYSGMGPGMLGGFYGPEQVRLPVAALARKGGGRFQRGRVILVEPDRHRLLLDSGETVSYDVVSFNTGSCVPMSGLARQRCESVFAVKPISNLLRARDFIREQPGGGGRRLHIVVVGGGPAGVEIAGNAWQLVTETGREPAIALVAARPVLPDMPGRCRQCALDSLERRGIRVQENARARRVENGRVRLEDGVCLRADVTFVATGVEPSTLYRDSGLPIGPRGGLLVNDDLQCVAQPEVFGGGDCIEMEGRSLARVGVHAVREGEVLSRNMLAALEGRALDGFTPRTPYLLILNMGDGTGIARKGGFVHYGPLAFKLKDYIDRRFVRSAQVTEHSGSGILLTGEEP